MSELEDRRNKEHSALFEAMIREAYDGVQWVGTGHHFMFQRHGHTLPEDVSSADTLIFDHTVAKRVWKADWQDVLTRLALEPAETRDALMHRLYHAR